MAQSPAFQYADAAEWLAAFQHRFPDTVPGERDIRAVELAISQRDRLADAFDRIPEDRVLFGRKDALEGIRYYEHHLNALVLLGPVAGWFAANGFGARVDHICCAHDAAMRVAA